MAQTASRGQNARQVFHLNINCSNLELSRAFYELIGYRVVNDFSASPKCGTRPKTLAELGLAPILRLRDDCEARALLLALSDDSRAPGSI